MAVPLQTWLIGNTVSDILIASAMLFFVSFSFSFRVSGRLPDADHPSPIPQLIQRRSKDGYLSSHALVSVVRLTVESNLMTSEPVPSPDPLILPLIFFSAQLQSVSYPC
jgi:hypothetical protein